MNPPTVKAGVMLRVYMTQQEALDLTTYLRRVNFDRTLNHCDACVSAQTREEECYRMIEALGVLETALDKARQ